MAFGYLNKESIEEVPAIVKELKDIPSEYEE